MEVVWIRQFTPYLGTVVYAFASILATYLVSTFIGLQIYRLWSQKNRQEGRLIWVLLGLFAATVAGRSQSQSSHFIRNCCACRRNRSFFRRSGLRHSPAGGSLVGRRSRPGRKSLCLEHPGLHSRTAALRLPAAAADKRALGIVHVRAALALAWRASAWFSERTNKASRRLAGRLSLMRSVLLTLMLVFTQTSFEDQFVKAGYSEPATR